MFAFPHDLRLSYSTIIRFPLPVFFSFVFTNSKGMHRYAACLRFYEIVPKEEILEVFREVYGPEQVSTFVIVFIFFLAICTFIFSIAIIGVTLWIVSLFFVSYDLMIIE